MYFESDINRRAYNKYKNKKFDFFLNEVISNSLHSCILSKKKDKHIILNIKVNSPENISIFLSDNGQGFNNENFENFKTFDKENQEKTKNNIKSFGQGRLAIIAFVDECYCDSIYEENEKFYERKFSYPIDSSIFNNIKSKEVSKQETLTKFTFNIIGKNKLKKVENFLKKYDNEKLIAEWIFKKFFVLFQKNKDIKMEIQYNEVSTEVSIAHFSSFHKQFSIKEIENGKENIFDLYGVSSSKKEKSKIYCCAKDIVCDLPSGINFDYNLKTDKDFYLTSMYFDNLVDDVGAIIDLEHESVVNIQKKINETLDESFKEVIKENQKLTKENLSQFKDNFPSYSLFIEDEEDAEFIREPLRIENIEKIAVERKNKAEIALWKGEKTKYENQIIKSSLFNYIKHRKNILGLFKNDFLERYKQSEEKKENEALIQKILFPQSKNKYQDHENDYFLHNLWLIDDKYSLFTTAQSTVSGKKDSDIYLYCDKEQATEIVIIELKSSHNAHNPKSMIKQVQNYAKNVYNNKSGFVKGSISNTDKCIYSSYIIASNKDIKKQKEAAEEGGAVAKKIPFLSNSYYMDVVSPQPHGMRIELISYDDLYSLANSRNQNLINLMYRKS